MHDGSTAWEKEDGHRVHVVFGEMAMRGGRRRKKSRAARPVIRGKTIDSYAES